MGYLIATDTGGTFTDTVILDEDGACFFGKALSTPKDFSHGVLDSIDAALPQAPGSASQVYGLARIMSHGTTVTTNALIQRKGSRTGLLITKGFEDTLLIGRVLARVVGLTEAELTNYQKADKPEPIVPVALTRGLHERIDRNGQVLRPLDLDEVVAKVDELMAQGIEALAVCLLWSFKNPTHERMVRDLLASRYPGLHVVVSSDLVPVMGEYERANTAAINAYVGLTLGQYLGRLGASLQEKGLKGPLLIMQSVGGLTPAAEAQKTAAATLYSGPAGGIVAAQMAGRQMSEGNIITTDMGGTSFDVGLIVDGAAQTSQTTEIGRHVVSIPAIEVVSIGAGGGSIAWVGDPVALMVGPQSAGAWPGPACYGFGGERPTVTDADVVLGYINPDNFLGGRIKLDPQKAEGSLKRHIADRLGMSVVEAAAAVYQVVNAHMADLIRKVTIERGYDPREFVLFAFGGGGPTHCTAYGPDLGVRSIIVPQAATVFSAYGIAHSDIKHFYTESNPIVIGDSPDKMDMDRINEIFHRLSESARKQLELEGVGGRGGFETRPYAVAKALDIRYQGQIHELTIPVHPGTGQGPVGAGLKPAPTADPDPVYVGAGLRPAPTDDLTFQDLADLRRAYEQKYEMLYGAGASSKLATTEIVTFRVDAVCPTPFHARTRTHPREGADPSNALSGQRQVYWPSEGGYVTTPIFIGERLQPGNKVEGPAVLEMFGTTLPLHQGQRLEVDEFLNFVVTFAE
ncbi:MAG: hydantoinase/oxoprolinase family protein [Dehalococcoidia bacterium]|nr:hydantoinase/oxoprolinase family protein [Dehalococcoidia bacterium]